MEEKFLVYENWRAEQKAVVHKSTCSYAYDSIEKITNVWLTNNNHPNDRWFGYFISFEDASKFAELLPNRSMKCCNFCIK